MTNVKRIERREPLEHFYCLVCGKEIAPERFIRRAVTCSDAHARLLKLERRRLRDLTRCRLCNRPSTPEERQQYAAWRRTLGIKRGPKPQPKPNSAPILDDDEMTPDARPEGWNGDGR